MNVINKSWSASDDLPSSSSLLSSNIINQCDKCHSLGVDRWPNLDTANLSRLYCTNHSETSSITSGFSSDQETNDSHQSNGSISSPGQHDPDSAPDSPDSGLSDSTNIQDEKIMDEYLKDVTDNYQEYFQILYHKTGHGFSEDITLLDSNHHFDKNNSSIEIITLDDDSDEDVKILETSSAESISSEPETIVLEDSFCSDNDATLDDQVLDSSFDSQKTVVEDQDSYDGDETFEKELKRIDSIAGNLLDQIPKGFDAVFEALNYETEKSIENDPLPPKNKYEINIDSVSRHDYGFDFPLESIVEENLKRKKSFDWTISKQQKTSDMKSMIKQMKIDAKNLKNIHLESKPKIFHCQWHDCDWPGNYEDLADHLREIHVELQPFLDPNGNVIKWNKKKLRNEDSFDIEDDDEGSSQTTLDEDDDDSLTGVDEDSQSSSKPSFRSTRRSRSYKSFEPVIESKRLRNKSTDSQQSKIEKFVCLWRGCKVFGKPSMSRHWIERHVLESHSGPKPFKCIVDGCGQRFRTQNQLEKHVNMHFRSTNEESNQENINQPTSDLLFNPESNDNPSKHTLTLSDEEKFPISSSSEKCCQCNCHSFLSGSNECDTYNGLSTTPSSNSPFKSNNCHASCCMDKNSPLLMIEGDRLIPLTSSSSSLTSSPSSKSSSSSKTKRKITSTFSNTLTVSNSKYYIDRIRNLINFLNCSQNGR